MTSITQQRCSLHAEREAAAHCPVCHKPFCRECVTEHDDRIICAACLREAVAAEAPARARQRIFPALGRATLSAAGLLALWLIFYVAGQALLRLPATFHEGNLWMPDLFEPTDET